MLFFCLCLHSQSQLPDSQLPVWVQSGKELGRQQWRSNRLEKLDVFKSIGLERKKPKLMEHLLGLSVRLLSTFKEGTKEDLGNDMPVSFTSVSGKIREHTISSSQPR